LYVILDCCHNGTGCDVRYKYEDFSLLIAPPSAGRAAVWRTQQKAFVQGKYTETAGEVFMISGSRDEQTSADAYINNAFAGALTYAVFAILRANQAAIRTYSWSSLLRDVRHFMRVNRYSQVPQVMTGQLISPARPVFAVAVAAGAGAGNTRSLGLEENIGSNSMGYTSGRGVSSGSTMFHFRPNSGSKRSSKASLQFIH
jgi:hypothetical protein